jgi:flagellar protein FlaJ
METSIKLSLALSLALIGATLAFTGFSLADALPFLPVVLFLGLAPYLVVRYMKYTELKQMEEAFPEFLRNLSESQKSGITFPKAIINSTKIEYGPLSKEVKKMAYQLSWGVPLPRVLEKFSERVKDSDFLRRSIAIVLESYRSGGDVAEVMESVAESARMVKELESERRSKFNQQLLVMYAIFIIFIVIIIALNKILLPMFALSANEDVGGVSLSMGSLDPEFYRTTFLHMILMQAVFAGLIAGQVGEGSIVAGIKHSAIMLALGSVAFILFLPSQQVLITVETPFDVYPPGSLYTLEGFVLKTDKTPLGDAEVEIDVAGTLYQTKTDTLGAFSREVMLPSQTGTHQIRISATHPQGKGSYTMEVRVG